MTGRGKPGCTLTSRGQSAAASPASLSFVRLLCVFTPFVPVPPRHLLLQPRSRPRKCPVHISEGLWFPATFAPPCRPTICSLTQACLLGRCGWGPLGNKYLPCVFHVTGTVGCWDRDAGQTCSHLQTLNAALYPAVGQAVKARSTALVLRWVDLPRRRGSVLRHFTCPSQLPVVGSVGGDGGCCGAACSPRKS